MNILTTDYDPTKEIDLSHVGQNYILSVNTNKTSDFIGDAFICRDCVKKNKVYVKIFSTDGATIYNSETKTIAITDKCVYDVTVNTIQCSSSDFCATATLNIKFEDFTPKILGYTLKIVVCTNNLQVFSEVAGVVPTPQIRTLSFLITISKILQIII